MKYPGIVGTARACTVDGSDGLALDVRQRICSEEEVGPSVGGRAAWSQEDKGMEVMTTWGTWYVSWRVRRAVRRAGREVSGVSVSVLRGS